VEALNNPKEYMSREKRSEQLKEKLGIHTDEIVDVPIEAPIDSNYDNNNNIII
jgi:hypothetical protein